MEILGIGPAEALLIMIVALLVFGPKDLGKAARSAGKLLNRLYRSEAWKNVSEASRNLRTLPNRLAREAALEELDEMRETLTEAKQELRDEVKGASADFGSWDGRSSEKEPGSEPDPDD